MTRHCPDCGDPITTISAYCRQCDAEHRKPPPSPEEIAARAAEVRARWSDEDELKRRGGKREPLEVGTAAVVHSGSYGGGAAT